MNLREIEILQFAVTDRCNLKCIMCHQGTLEYQKQIKRDFSLDLFRGVLDDMAGNGFSARALYFFWNGETFLHPDFLSMLHYAYNLNAKNRIFDVAYLNTNAGLLDPEKSDQLISILDRSGSNVLSILNFSIDAVNEQTYKAIRRGGNFRKTVENIKYLVRKRSDSGLSSLYFIFQIIVQPGNFNEVEDFSAYWSGFLSELKLPHEIVALEDLSYLEISEKKKHLINIRPLLTKGIPDFDRKAAGIWNYWKNVLIRRERENPQLPEIPDDRCYIVPIPELNLAALENQAPQRRFLGGTYLRKNPCPYLFKTALIKPDGEVTVCCRDPFHLGNLNQNRFSEIWLSPDSDKKRNLSLNLDFAALSPGCVHCSDCDESFWKMLYLPEISNFYQNNPPEQVVSFVRTLPEKEQKLILEKALFFSESGDIALADRLFSMLDDSAINLIARASFEVKTGKTGEAVRDYLRLLEYPELKNRGEIFLSVAILKIREHKNGEGLHWLDQAENLIPDHPKLIEQKAYLLMSAEPQKALEYFLRLAALADKSEKIRIYLNCALLCFKTQNSEKALEYLCQAEPFLPENISAPEDLAIRAYLLEKFGKTDDAVRDYLKLLDYPDLKNRGEIMLSLGLLKLGIQKNDEGLYWLNQAEQLIPDHPKLIEQKAYLLMSAEPQKALEYFLRLAALADKSEKGRIYLASAFLSQKMRNPEKTLEYLRQAEPFLPDEIVTGEVLTQKAHLLENLGKTEEAFQAYLKLIEKNGPATGEHQLKAGYLALELKDEKQALTCFESASRYCTNELRINEVLASLYRKEGDYSKSCCLFLGLHKKFGSEHYLLEFLRTLSLHPEVVPLFSDDLTDLDKSATESEALFLLFSLNRSLNRTETCFKITERLLSEKAASPYEKECALFSAEYFSAAGNYAAALFRLKKGRKQIDQQTFNYQTGEILNKAGKKRLALKYFRKLGEAGLERTLALLDSMDRSLEVLELCRNLELIQKNWGKVKLYLLSLWKTGKYQEGMQVFNNGNFDKNEEYYRLQGGFALKTGESETALASYAMLENTAKSEKDRLEFLETEGYILRKLGRKREALKKYYRILKSSGRKIHALKAMLCTFLPGKN
ncbi:MAG: SPASM domain-containing protein [Candidatus Wallbacteria bacterium]|nr:SPASM domain-containing protein [Candidatus Wallbacteria bacterium]